LGNILLHFFLIGLLLMVLSLGFEPQLVSLLARGSERKLQEGTTKAYSGAAAVDLRLAHKAIAAGDLAGGESRLAQAQDKLYAPQLHGRTPAPVRGELEGLESRYGKEFQVLRRKRALDRLGREGAEVRGQDARSP